MDINGASERLRALARDDTKRSETARLRDIFEDVEAALRAGVSQATVLGELKALGYSMTLASFKSALQRIRKERNKAEAPVIPGKLDLGKSETPKASAAPDVLGSDGEKLVETNPLRKLSGNKKPGEFNPIPSAKVEFD